MTEDHLQWLTLAFMFFWLLMISRWVGETTNLLKAWWSDWLKPNIKGGLIKPTRLWPDPPKNPYTPKGMRYPPKTRNGDD